MSSMPIETLELWTWQSLDRDITVSHAWDPSRMPEAWGKRMAKDLIRLYDKLNELLGVSDYIWCFDHYENWPQLERRRLWRLQVPPGEILAFVDNHRWKALRRREFSEFCAQAAWDGLFVPAEGALDRVIESSFKNPSGIVPLVSVPVHEGWVCDNKRFNSPCDRGGKLDTPHKDLPLKVPEEEMR